MIRYGIRPGKRLLSTQIPSVTYASEFSADSVAPNVKNSVANAERTVSESVSQTSSDRFMKSLSASHFTSLVANDAQVKTQMYGLLKDKQFDQLFQAMEAVSMNWRKNFLDKAEITFFLSHLVDHQLALLIELTKLKQLKFTEVNEGLIQSKTKQVDQWRNRIRDLYSKLLFGNKFFIYSKVLRTNIHDPSVQKQATGYSLSIGDYENLIRFEYGNNKLDLANKWFERFDMHYQKSDYTSDMWNYKFKISGGDPNLWEQYSNEIFDVEKKVVKSHYKKEDFNSILTEYLKYSHIDEHLPTIIHCLGNMKLVNSIFKIIEGKYGINDKGDLVERKSVPDLNLLNALVVALSYNQKYWETMKLLNTFQTEFGIDLSGKESKFFWENLIKWTDLSSRYNVQKILHYYVKNHNPEVRAATAFKELLKDTNFDYEQYLSFLGDIRQKRTEVMKQVWQLYRNSNQGFSVKNFKVYSQFLKKLGTEDEIFANLEDLNKLYYQYNVSRKSFNFKYLGMNTTINTIENLYIYNMINLIDRKMKDALISQVPVLINEWGLNKPMKDHLTHYYERELPKVQEQLMNQQDKEMKQQREEDEDRLLQLW